MPESLLLEIIIVLLGALLAMLAFVAKWHLDDHKKMSQKLELINENCADYAENKESHSKIWEKLNSHTQQLSEVKARVAVLETKAIGNIHGIERTNIKR